MPPRLARAKSFVTRNWKSLLAGLGALFLILIAIFKPRRPDPDDVPTVPSGPTRAAAAHTQGTLERQQALAARAAQEAAAQRQAELEAAQTLRAEEERLRRVAVDAGASAAAANVYADRVSRRKETP